MNYEFSAYYINALHGLYEQLKIIQLSLNFINISHQVNTIIKLYFLGFICLKIILFSEDKVKYYCLKDIMGLIIMIYDNLNILREAISFYNLINLKLCILKIA